MNPVLSVILKDFLVVLDEVVNGLYAVAATHKNVMNALLYTPKTHHMSKI